MIIPCSCTVSLSQKSGTGQIHSVPITQRLASCILQPPVSADTDPDHWGSAPCSSFSTLITACMLMFLAGLIRSNRAWSSTQRCRNFRQGCHLKVITTNKQCYTKCPTLTSPQPATFVTFEYASAGRLIALKKPYIYVTIGSCLALSDTILILHTLK